MFDFITNVVRRISKRKKTLKQEPFPVQFYPYSSEQGGIVREALSSRDQVDTLVVWDAGSLVPLESTVHRFSVPLNFKITILKGGLWEPETNLMKLAPKGEGHPKIRVIRLSNYPTYDIVYEESMVPPEYSAHWLQDIFREQVGISFRVKWFSWEDVLKRRFDEVRKVTGRFVIVIVNYYPTIIHGEPYVHRFSDPSIHRVFVSKVTLEDLDLSAEDLLKTLNELAPRSSAVDYKCVQGIELISDQIDPVEFHVTYQASPSWTEGYTVSWLSVAFRHLYYGSKKKNQ